eukprot:1566829-Pyramimonas_sp.AAC.1
MLDSPSPSSSLLSSTRLYSTIYPTLHYSVLAIPTGTYSTLPYSTPTLPYSTLLLLYSPLPCCPLLHSCYPAILYLQPYSTLLCSAQLYHPSLRFLFKSYSTVLLL